MELRHLRYFIAVAEGQSFRKASARLNISQSAISRQIQDLEQDIGVQLFERLPTRRVQLTAAGATFLEDVHEILAMVQSATQRALRTMQGFDGDLHIAFNEMASRDSFFRECVGLFRTRAPNVRLKLTAMQSDRQIEAIRENKIDVGFLALRKRWQISYEFLECEFLHKEKVLLALPAHHRLTRQSRIFMKDLAEEPFVYLPRSHSPLLFDEMLAACQRGGFSPNVVQSVVGELNILGLVSAGVGLGFVSASAAAREQAGLEYREVEDLGWTLTMGVASSSSNSSPQLAHFLSLVEQLYHLQHGNGASEITPDI